MLLLLLPSPPQHLKGSVEFPVVVGPLLFHRALKPALLSALLFHHIWWEGQVVGDSMGDRREQMNWEAETEWERRRGRSGGHCWLALLKTLLF